MVAWVSPNTLRIATLLLCYGASSAQLNVPDAPTSVALDVLSGSDVRVSFEAPLTDGGSAIQSYSLEWDTDPGVQEIQTVTTSTYTDANEIQTITTTSLDSDEVQLVTTNATVLYEIQTIETKCDPGGTLGGTFALGLDTTASGGSSEISGEISFDAAAEGSYLSLKKVLENMKNVGPGGVIGVDRAVTDAAKGSYLWTVTFATHLGNLPELTLRDSSLTGTGATVDLATVRDQNLLGGSFRLSYGGYTTAAIPHDATGGEVATALEALSTVDSVDVYRVGPTDQGGYNWTVTFTSDYNGADLPEMVATYVDLTGSGASAVVTTLRDGNELSGSFNLTFSDPVPPKFGWSADTSVPFDATPSQMKAALESLGCGEVAVHRSGPDFELGYVWTVSFVEKEGDVPLLEASAGTSLNGDLSKVRVRETRKGTVKEVQTISTFGGSDGAVNASTKFFLRFRGQTTGVIEANPNATAPSGEGSSCDATAREVQQIRTTTVDTFGAGGDDHVSSLLYFSLVYYSQDGTAQETVAVDANPQGGDCKVVADAIESALEDLDAFEEVTVGWSAARDDEGCTWRVTFDDQAGNLDQMSVKVQGGANTGAAAVGFWGDDTVTVTTVRDGTVDAIKYELEKLTTVGTVTVDPGNATADGGCSWRVTFETNTGTAADDGALTPLTVASIQKNGTAGTFSSSATAWPDASDSIAVCAEASQCVAGTSVQLGGQWTAQFRGHRTLYVDHDVSARGFKEALEALPSVGRVDVTREGPDENLGYTWSVTFLTELGDLPALIIDQQALTGTAPYALVTEADQGVFPPFDSLDPSNGLPLGSSTLTALDDLSVVVGSLEQGIPYYFRVSALNANGQGPAALASPAFAVPLPQSATAPTSVKLAVVDGGSLAVSLAAPERDGGEEIDRYRVQYATQQFAQEVQTVRVACEVEPEIQVVSTGAQDIDEVQVVHAQLEAGYDGLEALEVQEVVCDATAGSFTLSIFGETTADIFVADSAKDIQARLQELSRLNSVNVSFPSGVSQACADCADGSSCATGFNVTFQDVEGAAGDMPILKPDVKGLHGNRRVNVMERVRGASGLGGSFRLTFRGFTTVDIHHNASAEEVQAALSQLDPIPYSGGVSVTRVADTGFERMWRVTFEAPEVGGNVESMTCPDHDMRLYGNGAQLSIHSDGLESALNRRYTEPSVKGNELGGAFTLNLLGHTTEPIDFNAADTQMKARLEALPNIGVVDVARSSPSPEKGYAWTITFVSNPGSFPVASSDVEPLEFDLEGLSGLNVTGNVTEVRAGVWPLGGTFQLRYTNGTQYRTTTDLAHNSDPSEFKAALEALDDMVGKVSVERSTNVDGYTWSITFGPCQTDPVTGADVCNDGDLYPLELASNGTLEGCEFVSVSVAEVVTGSGPDLCPLRDSGLCFDDVTDLSGGAPYTYEIAQLDVGTPYYVRVAAHTDESFGTYAASTPEFAVPSHLQPGPPPRVRLVSSTETTITLEWDHPTEHGGSPVTGYELWMDDWEGGNMLKVYDGTADPDTLSFTVDSANAPHLESGRKYQFTVRALNLCRATDDDLACYSDFSAPAAFTVRAPRPPLAPPQVLRDSAGTSTGARGVWGDGSITVYWVRPVDNGGSPITAYRVFMESPDGNVTQVLVDPSKAALAVDQSATFTPAVGHERQYRYTFDSLDEGEVYVFQVAAVNAKGRSGLSAPVAVVCAERPGGALSGEGTTDANKTASFGLVKPTVVDVTATSIELHWDEPADRGVSPITGYQVYMYPGAALNTQADPEPVKQEVQVITTSVSTPVSEVQVLTISDARGGGQFRLRVRASSNVGGTLDETTELVTLGACNASCLATALESVGNSSVLGTVRVTGPVVQNSSHAYTVTFAGYVGPLQALALVDHSLVDRSAANTWYHSVVRVVKGTEPLRGTFTVSFQGFETPALPYNVSAYELERELNNLDSIDMVSVSRSRAFNDGDGFTYVDNSTVGGRDNFGAYSWTVTFVNVMGDVPLLYPSPGRLTCSAETASCAGVDAVAVQPGTEAVLVYDGTHAPNVREFVATGLTTDALYSFKVVPLNAVGRGLPSAATATVAARVGASASQTTVRGGSVSVGMAGVVYETQVVTAYDTNGHFSLSLGSWFGESLPLFAVTVGSVGQGWDSSPTRNELNDPNDEDIVSSAAAVEAALTVPGTGIEKVHVTRSAAAAVDGSSGVSWTVTFLSPLGNVPTLRVNSTNVTSGKVTVSELLAGAANEFIVEPKKASGAPVKDVTARSNFGSPGDDNGLYSVDFAGQDMFFTELWKSNVDVVDGTHEWDSDGGVATYNPVLYEIQRLYLPAGTTGGFRLKFDQTGAFPGKKDQVCAYVSGGLGAPGGMAEAPSAYDSTTWLGGGNDGSWGYECTGPLATLGGQGAPRLLGESHTTANITVNASALQVKLALEQLPNIEAVDVTFERSKGGDMTYLVTFTHDLGDLPLLQYVAPSGDASATGAEVSSFMNITEIQEGYTEVQTITTDADIGFTREVQSLGSGCDARGNASGYFNVTLPGADKWVRIPYDANASLVKQRLQTLSNVGRVSVTRQPLSAYAGDKSGAHFLWSVTFFDPVGDVPDLKVSAAGLSRAGSGASCYVDVNEVTKGASPLGGTFVVSFGADYTDDLDFDASAVTMKAALEALPSIDQVNVRREDLGTGHRWEVTFTKALGDLPEMVAHMHRYEEQHVRTLGGDPTPLGGSFSLRYGGASTAALPHDASASAVKVALESLPTVNHVDVGRDVYNFGHYRWRVTFRSEVGDLPMLVADTRLLTGSDARATVTEHVSGDGSSLTGSTPFVRVAEKSAGLPSYTALYHPTATGPYTLAVRQLSKGGLSAAYFDNQWLLGDPAVERVDPAIAFDWGTGTLTRFGRDYVSARWVGKLRAPTTELYTFYLYADDGARLWIDHVLVLDSWEASSSSPAVGLSSGGYENRCFVNLTQGTFHDVRLEYKEETGKAAIKLEWSSFSTYRGQVPSSVFYYATHVSGSPYQLTVLPGASDYPYTSAEGTGLEHAVAGEPAFFTIQARDQNGNARASDQAAEDGDFLNISLYRHNRQLGQLDYEDDAGLSGEWYNGDLTGYYGSIDMAPSTMGKPEYLGDGRYRVSYTVLKSGYWKLHVKSGGTDIECGRGSAAACSPFTLFVDPGPTIAQTTEVEGALSPLMDGLVEAAAGDMAYFSVQAKDTYGNNRIVGGDDVRAVLAYESNKNINYRGHVLDHHNGTYLVTYTLPRAGMYKVDLTIGGQRLNSCSPPVYSPVFRTRQYDGLRVYHAPHTCAVQATSLLVVHGPLQASQTTVVESSESEGLTKAVVGVRNVFTIEARDEFGNLRAGDGTNHFGGYGSGQRDPFTVDFAGPAGSTYKTSSAVMTLSCNNSFAVGTFRLGLDGATTLDLPLTASASAIEAAIFTMHPGDPHLVRVSRSDTALQGSDSLHSPTNKTFAWSVTFLSHLDRWAEVPMTVERSASSTASEAAFHTLSLRIVASRGLYPCAYTLWYKGSYFMSVRHFNGEHVMGSPFMIEVDDGATEAATSFAQGPGLVGGVAGQQLTFTVTARDVRQYEYQAVYTNATVVPAVAERQTVTVSASASGSVGFTFRGESTVAVSVGSSWSAVETALEALATVDDVELSSSSQTSATLTAGSSFDVLFVGPNVRGDVPLLKGDKISAAEARKGDAPFVREVQTLECSLSPGSVASDQVVAFEVRAPAADAGGVGGFRVGDSTASSSASGYVPVLAVSSNASVASFQEALSAALGSEVEVTSNAATSASDTSVCAVGGGTKLFVTFTEARGDVRALAYNTTSSASSWASGWANASVVAESGGQGGSVDGVHPLWGDFTLTFKGYTTRPLSFDASAEEVEAALERLPSVGGVTVEHVVAGAAVDTLGHDFYLNETGTSDYWLVGFDGICANSTADWGECPEHIGDEPLLFANGTGLKYHASPHVKQAKPYVGVMETKPGSAGNNRAYGSDGQNVQEEAADFTLLGVSLVHETAVATPRGGEYVAERTFEAYDLASLREARMKVRIGNFEVHALECVSSDLAGSFELYFLGDTLTVPANATLLQFQELLHEHVRALATAAGHFLYPPTGDAAAASSGQVSDAVTVSAADGVQQTVCAHREPAPILLSFRGLSANRANPAVSPASEVELNYGTLPEVNATATFGAVVKTYELSKGLDYVRYVGDGKYEVAYTPTVKGQYDVVLTLDGVELSTDLSNGVLVTPATARAAQSEHSSDSVAVEGVTETFTIQARDAFDNSLDGHARGLLSVTLDGASTYKASGFPTAGTPGVGYLGDAGVAGEALWGQDGLRALVERPLITSASPNTNGVYQVEWMPRVAGTYTFSANYTDFGGLLATYFRQPDGIAGAVLTDDSRFVYPYHSPNHCPLTQLSAEHGFCDSTQLDPTVSFDWGVGPPSSVLVLDHTAEGRGHSDGRDGRTTHPPAANFPTDFWSARWDGFLDPTPPSSSSSSMPATITFALEADEDGMASVSVGGVAVVGGGTNTDGAGSRVVGNWSVPPPSSAARSVNGVALWPIEVTYAEGTREAKVELTWSFDGGSSFAVVPSSKLYHTRHVEESPYTYLVYPGEVDPHTSSASGDGLSECTTMRTCFFTIQGRDSMANQRFNSGDDDWLLTLTGVGDWAGDGRVNDEVFLYTDDKQYFSRERRVRGVRTVATAYYPEVEALDWEYLGVVEAVRGLRYVNVSSVPNATSALARGDTIVVCNETLVVDTAPSARFDQGVIPLADPYRSPSDTCKIWKGGERTGTYRVSYHPKVRGDYRLDVQRPAIQEVQVLETFVDPGSPLGGNFSLVFQGLDILSGLPLSLETGPIGFNASAEELQLALAQLANVDMVNVTKENCANPMKKCKWAVTFDRVRFDPAEEVAHLYSAEDLASGEPFYPLLIPDVREMRGNNASLAVTEVTQGRPPLHVSGSPFFVHVATNDTHPPTSTAFGRGLYSGVTGETSAFTIQSKDDFGNDRTDGQSLDDFLVVPFLAEVDYDVFESRTSLAPDRTVRTHPPPVPLVASAGDGKYGVEFVPTISGDYTVAVLVALAREQQRVVTSFPEATPKRREGTWTLTLRHTGGGVASGNGAADSLHIPETALVETSPLAWDASAENLKQALLDLGVCGTDIEVSRSDLTHSETYLYDYPSRHERHAEFGATSNFGYTYDVTFHNYVGDLPLLEPNFALTLVGGTVNTSEVVAGTCEHIKTEASPLVKETQVVRVAADGPLAGTFVLGFRGHSTQNLAWDATAEEVERALEALLPIGSVSVERNATKASTSSSSSSEDHVGFEYTVVFEPDAKCDRRHALSYGDLPALTATSYLVAGEAYDGNNGVNASLTVFAGGYPSADGTPTYDGSSPWSKSHQVVSSAVSAEHTTAVDSPGAYGEQGLRSGTYNATSRFTIESRDRFSNRVLVGPLTERQIVTTQCAPPCNLLGSFTVSYRGHSVELDAGAGIAELESALEALDTLGAVTVTTYGVHDPVGSSSGSNPDGTATVQVVHTDPDVYPSSDLSAYLSVGDWVRLDAHDGFVYSVVGMKATFPYTIRLNKPYEGASNVNASVWRQDKLGNVHGYQYIVDFDSNTMGDLPALVVNGSGLIAGVGGNETRAAVTWCDWQQRQTISTSASSMINGTFYLEYGGDRTRDLPFNANSSEVEAELNALDSIYACAVEPAVVGGAFGMRSWTVNLHSVAESTSGSGFEPIFAEGHLLLGENVRIDVAHDCASNGRGAFPHQCNTTDPDTGGPQGSFLVHGCEVQSVAGRLGSEYLVALAGEGAVSGVAEHVGSGLYRGEFVTPRTGEYELTVAEAECCGLRAELFNNRWLIGEPVLSRVDPLVDFVWSAQDLISPTGRDYVSVRWSGWVRPTFSEEFEFVLEINDGARLFLDGELLLDAFEDEVDDDNQAMASALGGNGEEEEEEAAAAKFNTYRAPTSSALVADRLYHVKLEYRESTGAAVARLLWRSASQPLEVVPSHRLAHGTTDIVKSPFHVSPMPIEPLQVVDVSLSIAGWDSLNVFWYDPWDDGGSPVDGFRVEWWSAVPGAYGAKEVQTLKFASTIDSGTWHLRSPGGILHHSPLDWNVTSDVLELALETFADVGDVTVTYQEDGAKGSRNYRVVFETDLGNLTALGIDGGNLAALDGSGITTAVVCAHGRATSALCNATDSVAGNASLWGSTTSVDLDVEEGEPYHIVIPDLGQKSAVPDGFSVRVFAHTAGGTFQHDRHKGGLYGLASPPVTLKPMAVPEAPGHVEARLVPASDDSLRVHWTDVSTDPAKATGLLYGDRCSPVDAYLVEWDVVPTFDSNARLGGGGGATSSTAANPNPSLSTALGSSLRSPSFYRSPRVPNATDANWFSYVVAGLEPGTPYFIRVSARNEMGLGAFRPANTDSKELTSAYGSLAPRTAPVQLDFGLGVSLSTIPAAGASSAGGASSSSSSSSGAGGSVTVRESTSSLLVQFTAPGDERGGPVLDYLVEWWRADDFGRREVQVIKTGTSDGGALRGTFEVAYDGYSTDTLAYDLSEEDMESALEGLEPLRDVQVTRSANQNASSYQWTVTFLSEHPFVDNQALSVDGSGLSSTRSASSSSVTAQVGFALTKGLPGFHGEAALDVEQGSTKVRVSGSGSSGLSFVRVGDWVRLGTSGSGGGLGAVHRVVGKDAANVTFTLETPFEGSTASAVSGCAFGVTVPGKAPRALSSAVVAPFDSLRVGKASYTVTGLFVNVAYGVRVSARNDRGLSAPQFSTPASAAPPQQKPDKPQDVLLLGDSDTSLRVLFNSPDDDGGVTVTKYKIEWDTSPLFNGGVGGSVLGSHHKMLSQPVGACGLTPCEYIISGLTKGTRYFVRVFAYNKFGFSLEATPTSPSSEVPCTYALPPSSVTASPVGALGDALEVRFSPSSDDGGCPVTKYKVEWDPAGALGFQEGASPTKSLLYGQNEVQVVTVASHGKNDLGGTFRLALDDMFASDPIPAGASAAVVEAELNALATAGGVRVSRRELKAAGSYGFSYTVTFVGAQGGGKRWVGDVAALKVSTNASDFPSEFQSADSSASDEAGVAASVGGTLTGSGPPSVTATTAVDGARGFEQQQIQLWASSGSLRGTFRVGFNPNTLAHEENQGGALSAPLPWNASAAAVADALVSVGAGPNVRVARELHLHAMTEASHASSRLAVSEDTAGGGGGPQWDGEDTGIRYVVVFEGSTLAGSLPLVTLDGSGLRSTNYSAAVKHNVSTLVVGETPTFDSALKGQAVLAVVGRGNNEEEDVDVGAFVDLGDDGMPSTGYVQARDALFLAEGYAKNQEPTGVYGDGSGGGGGAPTEVATWDAASGSFVKTVTGLVSGEAYHVRVSAYNGFGKAYGGVAYATPTPRFGLENYGVR